jgi:hypothetical protein
MTRAALEAVHAELAAVDKESDLLFTRSLLRRAEATSTVMVNASALRMLADADLANT